MTYDQLKSRFPNKPEEFYRENSPPESWPEHQPDNPGSAPQLEQHPGDDAPGEDRAQTSSPAPYFVHITSVRKKLCDPCGICEKFLVDSLRYCGLVPEDNSETIRLVVEQRKTTHGEQEHTEVTVTRLEEVQKQ